MTLKPSSIASNALFILMILRRIIDGTTMIRVAIIPRSKSMSFIHEMKMSMTIGKIKPQILADDFFSSFSRSLELLF